MIEELIKEQIREIYLEAKEQAKKELLPISQAELQEMFGFSNEYLKRFETQGLEVSQAREVHHVRLKRCT